MSLRYRWSILALALSVSACSYLPHWGVYKMDVNQGNYVTQDMVDKLGTGISRTQTKLILGTPLIADPFHANRWDYVYELHKEGRLVERRQFRVFFENDKLAKWEGEAAPAQFANYVQTKSGESTGTAMHPEEPGFFSRMWKKLGF